MNKMDMRTTGTIKEGKERYRSGVILKNDGLLGAGLPSRRTPISIAMFRITPQPGVDHEEAARRGRGRKLDGNLDRGAGPTG